MGRFRSKLKGQTKGKRWPKGQSASSNPDTRKHRNLAKSRFFQEDLGASGLTSAALKKHDAIQSLSQIKPVKMDEDVESSIGTQSSYQTMQSFASEWSECSNMSYVRFLKIFRANSALHKEMLAILAAITEVIKENGGSETATDYYCTLWRKAAQNAALVIINSKCFEKEGVSNLAADKVAEFCERTLGACMGGSTSTVLVSSIQAGQTTILHTLGVLKDTICHFSKRHIKKCCEAILRLMTLNYPIVTSCGMQVLHSLFSSQKAVIPAKLNAQLISALYEYQPATSDVQPTLAWVAVMQQAHVHLTDLRVSTYPWLVLLSQKYSITSPNCGYQIKKEVMSGATHAFEILLRDGLGAVCASQEIVKENQSKLEKCINIIQLGLGYQFNTSWHQVLHVVSIMFEVMGANCSDMLVDLLKSLAELRDSYKFSYNNELEHAVGAAVRSMGPEMVLSIISLKKDNGDLNINRSWLLPILKENIKFSTLEYFVKGILPLAIYCHNRSTQLAEANDGIGAHSSELLYLQLWNLLPCFCGHPTDIKESFKSIAKVLGMAISDKPELRLAVMASLRKLVACAKESENEDDLKELTRFDKNYLPILFNVYTTKPIGTDEEGQRLAALDTIKLYLSIARPELTQQLFSHAIERLNSSSDEPEDHFIKESILDLIRALVPYQNSQNVNVLYQQCVMCLPEIKNNKEQKKAYRILEEICRSESDGCKEFVKNNRKDVQKLLMKSLNTAAVSSKGARLRCLNYLINAQPQLDHESKLIRSVIPEAVLCCKDINEKCRAVAYEVLNTIGNLLMKHDKMQEYVTMVIAGLAGPPQMISCTILALASILHNFSGALGLENIKFILQSVCALMASPSREIVGSCLSFIKVYYTTLPSPMVAASLEHIVKSLCGMTEDCKRHFRLKIRDVLDRLVRKYGCESLTPFIPTTDTVMYKRLRNLRKLNARKKRMKDAEKEEQEGDSEEFTIKAKPKSMEEILADSDSELEDMETDVPKSRNKKQGSTWIEEDPDTIIDFTDPSVASKITATKPGQTPVFFPEKKKKEKDRGFKMAPDGRLIIKDDDGENSEDDAKKNKISFNSDDTDSEGDDRSIAETLLLTDRKRKRGTSSVKSGFSSASQPPMKYKSGGIGIHRPVGSSASVRSNYSAPGSDYRSKKAKGDVKKQGKLDPYAYLPLQRTALNKRLVG
ncbi:hypothetical protein NQ317_008936 [Molorchus minor]|uniref:RRP12-like protein n=1 Tax=Molorchus minor TaxID=1323400 RepID=A0ABQ9K2T5_9CUCU|nr:hypothetical protein NQ317_008936 [Molorchus minor]